ncbi:HEPN domain-containing protein [Acidianus sp. HS-5]|nr:HEPN domain-containing protein [Acidianus sp. HS-5]BDC17836.1 hypothetical protein HS5_07260 [Acidianus sp. HS-5]
MSNLPFTFCRRALDYLKASEDALDKDLYDVSGVLSQISAELSINARFPF